LIDALIQSAENAPRPKGLIGRRPSEPIDRLNGTHLSMYIPANEGAKRKTPA